MEDDDVMLTTTQEADALGVSVPAPGALGGRRLHRHGGAFCRHRRATSAVQVGVLRAGA